MSRPKELEDWIEIDRIRALLRDHAVFSSPDGQKTAVVCLENGVLISIFNKRTQKIVFANPDLIEGVKLIHDLVPLLKRSSGIDTIHDLKKASIEDLIEKGIKCSHCKIFYISYEDFLERRPRRGRGSDLFVDSFCWDDYEQKSASEGN